MRRITINANKVTPDEGIYQVDFFTDTKKLERPNVSAGDLLFDHYKANLAGYTGNNIRILGHSLGNQMAIVLTLSLIHI